jgi:hypothetical protein
LDKPSSEKSKMRSAEDMALEMEGLCWEIADSRAQSTNWKDRITAVSRSISVGWNRAKDLYYRDAKIIRAEELENARIAAAAAKAEARSRRDNAHLAWLECEIARHRAAGTEFRGAHVDGLVDLLRLARGEAGPVAVQTEITTD